MSFPPLLAQVWLRARAGLAGAILMATLSGCDAPFGLGLPTTRSLETGAAATLTTATSFEITGSYTEGSSRWTIDLVVDRNKGEHVSIKGPNVELEAMIVGSDAYYRGQQFLSAHMGNDSLSRSVVQAAGDEWWKSSAGQVPRLTELTDGNSFRSAFLGQSATRRIDHVSVNGIDAVDMSGPRADVFIAAQAPYRVLRVQLKHGVAVDGIRDGDFEYGHYGANVAISAPTSVIDFSNLSTLPPIYTVLSVDTSGCGSPCSVSAVLKNLGGLTAAKGASVVTFTMTDLASGQAVATCQAHVVPDVGFNGTTRVGCTITPGNQAGNAFSVTAVADNSGRTGSVPPSPPNVTPYARPVFACRLPVVTSSQAGWVTFPDGSFAADPNANVHVPGYYPGYPPGPFFWKSYDKAYERWVPVPRDSISPDGQHYAYTDPPATSGFGAIHVVDMATGADHAFRPAANNWAVIDYETEGVYVAKQPSGPGLPTGLWLLDPTGQRAFRQIDTSHSWQYISGGGAWATADPLTGHGPGPGSRLLRLDLKTGVIDSWYKRSDIEFVVTGADGAGHPLLQTSNDYANQLLLITAQNTASSLQAAAGSALPHLSNYIHPVTDAHGMWLGDTGGSLFLYTSAGGVQQADTVGTSDVLPAGGCH